MKFRKRIKQGITNPEFMSIRQLRAYRAVVRKKQPFGRCIGYQTFECPITGVIRQKYLHLTKGWRTLRA
ncbi:MAG: hypothetical protein WCL30_04100 [Pseudomonadota bacterium]